MRSTTFALLGITAALGLALVATVSQQGFSSLPGLPLPGPSAEPGEIDAARVVVEQPGRPAPLPAVGGRDREATASPGDGTRSAPPSGLSGSRQLAAATSPAGPPDAGAPDREAPAAPAPSPPPPSESASAAAASEPSPAPAAGAPPGKSTAVAGGAGPGDTADVKARDKASAKTKAPTGKPAKSAAYEPPVGPAPEEDAAAHDDDAEEAAAAAGAARGKEGSDEYRSRGGRGNGHGR